MPDVYAHTSMPHTIFSRNSVWFYHDILQVTETVEPTESVGYFEKPSNTPISYTKVLSWVPPKKEVTS